MNRVDALRIRFRNVCALISREYRGKDGNAPYARAYADAGLALSDVDAIQSQCLYLLSNLSHWRGPFAANARHELREIEKEIRNTIDGE